MHCVPISEKKVVLGVGGCSVEDVYLLDKQVSVSFHVVFWYKV